jgi:hypothetical protein
MRTQYWAAYRNVSMAIESWHAGEQNRDTLTQFMAAIENSPSRTPEGDQAKRAAVTAYLEHINLYGFAPHSCFEVAEGQPCPWHPKGGQVS